MKRREFIGKSAVLGSGLAAAGMLSPQPLKAASANDKIRLGIMGLGGRGSFLNVRLAERPDVDIIYLCDANARN